MKIPMKSYDRTSNREKEPGKCILIEFPGDARAFADHCRKHGLDLSEFLIIALQPEVKAYCREKQLKYTDTLPFFDNNSHQRASIKSHRLSTLIREELRFDIASPAQVKPAYPNYMDTFVYYARFYLNNFIWIIEVMRGIKNRYGNIEINVFEAKQGEEESGSPFLLKKDRFVGALAERYCRANNLGFNRLPGVSPSPTVKPVSAVTAGRFYRLARKIAAAVFRRVLQRLSQSSAAVVFITVPAYNLDRVYREIKARFPGKPCQCVTPSNTPQSSTGYLKLCANGLKKRADKDIIPVPTAVFEKTTSGDEGERRLLPGLKKSFEAFMDRWEEEFVYENCSIKETLSQKVSGDLLDHLVELYRAFDAQMVLLQYLKPKLLISPLSTGSCQALAQCGRLLGIPSLVVPQKGLVAPKTGPGRIEQSYIGKAQVTDDFNYAAAQSPMVYDYLKWTGYKGTIIRTGNLIFSKVDSSKRKEKREIFFPGIGEDKKIIVYAPSMKSRKSRRFYVLETLDELLSSIADVVDAVSGIEDAHLVLRIHPAEPIKRKEIEALIAMPSNASVIDKGTFEDILTAAHLLISFSSTSIQEALFNHVPVVLYDKWKRYNHLGAPRVENSVPQDLSAAYYLDEPGFLSSSLRWILDHYPGNETRDELSRDYIYPGDYREKFFDFVRQCCEAGNG